MRIAFLCKRRYMGKDVVLDRYARLYEIPRQLARLGHHVRGFCMDYHSPSSGEWAHDAAPGSLSWESHSLDALKLPKLISYPGKLLHTLRTFQPALLIGASDIPHVVLASWLAKRLGIPYAVDLYDNFEGFGQARIPGFVPALRHATRHAAVVATTSEPLRKLILQEYQAKGEVIAMPSSVELGVFHPGDKLAARRRFGLPIDARLVGTAGGLYRDKGIEPLYRAWATLATTEPELHLVLAGPYRAEFPPPHGERIHYLGNLPHSSVADLFRALDVGIISVLDTPFGRYCFPQKAYEMLACDLPVVAASVGAMKDLFSVTPHLLFEPGDAAGLSRSVVQQLENPVTTRVPIQDWETLIPKLESLLRKVVNV